MLKEFRRSRKRHKKEKMEQLAREMESGIASERASNISVQSDFTEGTHRTAPSVDASGADASDGVEIETYAAAMGLSKSDVWGLLRRGELVGRTELGKLLVFARPVSLGAISDTQSLHAFEKLGASQKDMTEEFELPPLPVMPLSMARESQIEHEHEYENEHDRGGVPERGRGYLEVQDNKAIHPEIALLLDHLSLAKEENREIIKLTQDALTRVSTMTDTMIKMKDQLIGAKDEQLMSMKDILAHRDIEIRKLKQEREDLEMLARTLAEQSR